MSEATATPRPGDLLVDTSVCRTRGRWPELCTLARASGLRVFVSAITHGEMLRHLRSVKGPEFASTLIGGSMAGLQVSVLPVGVTEADAFAERVHALHPGTLDWRRAKQAHCLAMLHLGDKASLDDVSPNHHCSCTNDWFIAATAAAHDMVLVTDDNGPESRICERKGLDQALSDLRDRLTAPEPPNP